MSDTPTDAHRILSRATSARRDGMLSRDGRFRWSAGWGHWVPTGREIQQGPLPAPLESGPLLPPRHSESCTCDSCLTAGQHVADYLKQKALNDWWK